MALWTLGSPVPPSPSLHHGPTLIFTSFGASFFTSLSSLSPKPNGQERRISSQFSGHLGPAGSGSFLGKGPESKDQPLNRVEPPERTMLEKSVRLRSMSDFWMANTSTSWMPSLSSPIRSGLNRSSGARNREGPICRVEGQLQRWNGGRGLWEGGWKGPLCPPLSNQVAMKSRLRKDLRCQGLKDRVLGNKQGTKRNRAPRKRERGSSSV